MQLVSQDLAAFYEEPIGQVTRRMIFRRIRLAWPDMRGFRVLGYGFAMPYLKPLFTEAERVVALVPGEQGSGVLAADWRCVALGEEDALPFPDAMFDRVLMVHGLECAESTRLLLRQIWRVLAPNGRVMIVVPNRTSLWSQTERSPFAQGRPFSKGQLERLMREAMFTPERWDAALFFPPLRTRRLVRSGTGWERVGRACWPRFAGVHLLDASKSLYAAVPAEKVRIRKAVLARATR